MTTYAVRPAAPSTTPEVSDLRVDRVAGLSSDDLALALTDAVLAEAELTAAEKQTAHLADLVSDILFRLVPLLDDDPAARRRVLAVRRSSRPGKTPRAADLEAALQAARGRLGAGDCEALDLWAHAVTAREDARGRYEATYADDLERAGRVLTQVARDPNLGRGVAHASTSLGTCLDSVDTTPHRPSSRGLVSYATRAAYKTSPFGDLTTVTDNAGATGDAGPVADTGRPRRERLYVAPGVVHEWFTAMTADPDLVGAFEVEPLDLGGTDPHESPVLVPETVHTDAFAWVQDTRHDLSGYADLLDRLRWIGRRPVADYLEAIGGTDPFATLMRLAAVNVVRFVTPWGYGQSDRLGTLIHALTGLPSPRAEQLRAELTAIGATLGRVADAAGPDRAALLRDLPRPSLPGIPATAVFSDVTGGPAVPAAMPAAEAELTRVLGAARPLVFRSFMYAALVEDFRTAFGIGGRCDEVVAYLSAFAEQPTLREAMVRDACAPAAEVAEHRFAPVSRSSATPSCAVMYQVCAGNRKQAMYGDALLVVNQLNPGLGGLVSRFGAADEDGGPLRARLRQWIARLYPEAVPLEFVTASDVNDMQAVSEGTLPRLIWPTATPRSHDHADSVHMARLHLQHLPATDTLELRTADGSPVAPVYLGLVPAHLLGGASRLLALIGDPWVNRLSGLTRAPYAKQAERETVHLPRVQRGRVVLRRQTWVLPAGQVPTRQPQEREEDHFRRLQLFRQEAGLPENVFVRVDARPGSTAAKPMWTSFASPHAWAPVAERLKGATQITFTEQLPSPGDFWLTDDQGRTRAVEHISFLTWPTADSAYPEGLT